jgi:cardiolipin synthase
VNIPNAISLGRLLAVPVAIWLITSNYWTAAFWLFVAAGVSDALDGFIAKRFNVATELGHYLDPLADKALLVGVFLTLAAEGKLPVWLALLVVTRDFLIVGGVILWNFLGRAKAIKPTPMSKANTAAQIALAGLVLAEAGLGLAIAPVVAAGVYLVAATTVASGIGYLRRWLSAASPPEPAE